MPYLNGQFSYNGSPYNGATVSAWTSGTFATSGAFPEYDTPLPDSSYLVTSGETSISEGGQGSYRLEVDAGAYWVSIEAMGHITWAIDEAIDTGA